MEPHIWTPYSLHVQDTFQPHPCPLKVPTQQGRTPGPVSLPWLMKLPDSYGACLLLPTDPNPPPVSLSLSSKTVSGLPRASVGHGTSEQSRPLEAGWDEPPLSNTVPFQAGTEVPDEPPSCEKHTPLCKSKERTERLQEQHEVRLRFYDDLSRSGGLVVRDTQIGHNQCFMP